MISIKRPTAVVFGWNRGGKKHEFITTLFSDFESNRGWVDLYDIQGHPPNNHQEMHSVMESVKADVVVVIGRYEVDMHKFHESMLIRLDYLPDDTELCNLILRKYTECCCSPYRPKFSIFTPTYMTGEDLFSVYNSVKEQTLNDWEWVIVDDSPSGHNETWEIISGIANSDFRVKPHRINPNSNGMVGMVKKRACDLSTGEWLVELDHDDLLIYNCLEVVLEASNAYPDAGFIYSDGTEISQNGIPRKYDPRVDWDFYGAPDNGFNFGYSGHSWVTIQDKEYLQHHYPSINPLTIRFNISMPNHVRVWRKDVYQKVGGHQPSLPVADDLDLIIRTFLETRMVHIKRLLYVQRNSGGSTVSYNSFEINRLARIIKDIHNQKIHDRIIELGFKDWEWNDELNTNIHREAWFFNDKSDVKFWDDEQVLNYTYE